ncbi:sporadically distributed protein, TIGR04141 family, partial [Acinetobacter baumannii]
SFVKDSYESGESVEHIKLKATDKEIWGEKNIIFADSIQMDINKRPEELVEIFNSISDTVKRNPIINLPKLEAVTDEVLVEELDNELLTSLL